MNELRFLGAREVGGGDGVRVGELGSYRSTQTD